MTACDTWNDLHRGVRERVERAEDGLRLIDEALVIYSSGLVRCSPEDKAALLGARRVAKAIADHHGALALHLLRVPVEVADAE